MIHSPMPASTTTGLSPEVQFTANAQALAALHSIRVTGRHLPSTDELTRLQGYLGWASGAVRNMAFPWGEPTFSLRDVLRREDARTLLETVDAQPIACSESVAMALWRAVDRLCDYQFKGKIRAIDPCAGSGRIARYASAGLCSSLACFSPDPISSAIAKLCGVSAVPRRVQESDLPNGVFDLSVGAAPSDTTTSLTETGLVPKRVAYLGVDAWYAAQVALLLRTGGIGLMLLPHEWFDREPDVGRVWVASRCELIGAFRTKYHDLLIVRRRPRTVDGAELHWEHMLEEVGSLDEILLRLPVGVLATDPPVTRQVPPQFKGRNPAEMLAVSLYKAVRKALDAEIAGEPFEALLTRAQQTWDALKKKIGSPASALPEGTRERRLLEAIEANPALLAHRGLRSAPTLEDTASSVEETFVEPFSGRVVSASEYLSGRVSLKLKEAKAAAMLDESFKAHVEALEAVQPAPLTADEIRFTIGAAWMPADVLKAFACHIASVDRGVYATKIPCGGGWSVESSSSRAQYSISNTQTWGVPGMSGIELLDQIANLRTPVVTKKEWVEGKEKKVIDKDATAQAQAKVDEIKDEWRRWLKEHPEHTEKLGVEYNRLFRGSVRRQYSGTEQTFPGLALLDSEGRPFEPREHQKTAVTRISAQKQPDQADLVVHFVGYGKTASALMGLVRRWQLGLTDRTFIIVPKSVLRQWRTFAATYFLAYADEFMVAPEEFKQNFLGRVVAGEAAFIVLTYEQFASIPPSEEALNDWLERESAPVREALLDHPEDKALGRLAGLYENAAEKARGANAKRWAKLRERSGSKVYSWDAVVGDASRACIVFDEWQYLKKIPIPTKMSRVYGLPKDDSLRAVDGLVKTHGILLAGGAAGGLTGTPLTNSLAECFVAMRFFQPNRLRELGMQTFDDWAATFTEQIVSVEMDAVGEFRPVTRLRFVNMPELVELLGEVWSFASHSLEVKRPDLVSGASIIVEVEGSKDLQTYVEELSARAELVRSRQVSPKEDNMLKITSDGRKASMWNGEPENVFPLAPKRNPKPRKGFIGFKKAEARRIDSRVNLKKNVKRVMMARIDAMFSNDDEGPVTRKRRYTKVDACAAKVWELYHTHHADKGVQLVFCDLATPKAPFKEKTSEDAGEEGEQYTEAERFAADGVYGELRARIIEKGILPSQVAFIHSYKKEEDKIELFRKVNAGEIRVLIGSTDKLGVGTNPQRRVVAIHHLDCPWRPDQLIQRTGRGRRDGNLWSHVYEYIYVTTRSYDVCLWQLIQVKAAFISQLQEGHVNRQDTDDVGDLVLTAAMAKGLALGDQRVVDKIKLETQLAHLERQKSSWATQKAQAVLEMNQLPVIIESYKRDLLATQAASDLKARGEKFSVDLLVVGGGAKEIRKLEDMEVADSAVYVLGNSLRPLIIRKPYKVGQYRGRPLQLYMKHGAPALQIVIGTIEGVDSIVEVLNIHNRGTFAQLERELGMLDVKSASLKKTIEQEEKRLADMKIELDRPWANQTIAETVLIKYSALCESLSQKGLTDARSFKL